MNNSLNIGCDPCPVGFACGSTPNTALVGCNNGTYGTSSDQLFGYKPVATCTSYGVPFEFIPTINWWGNEPFLNYPIAQSNGQWETNSFISPYNFSMQLEQYFNTSVAMCELLAPKNYQYCKSYANTWSGSNMYYNEEPYTKYGIIGGIGFASTLSLPLGWYSDCPSSTSVAGKIIPHYTTIAGVCLDANSILPTPPGYTTIIPTQADNYSKEVVLCPEGNWCPGGTAPLYCPDGMWSSIGAKSVSECKPCEEGWYCSKGEHIAPIIMMVDGVKQIQYATSKK